LPAKADPDLNRLKNRVKPPDSYLPVPLKYFLKLKPKEMKAMRDRPRAQWTDAARAEAADWEKRGMMIEGYLLNFKQKKQAPESCNCYSKTDRDIHLNLVADLGSGMTKAKSMVMEISPRVTRPKWTLATLQQLANAGTRLRISGWLMYDQEHVSSIGKSRGTVWEVHPIHEIEYRDAAWVWRKVEER